MPSDAAVAALRDIEQHINLAIQFCAGFDYEAFREDARTLFAVTRCLEIISEASRRLPEEMKRRHTSIAWKYIAGAANVYRHDYEAANVYRHDYEDVTAKLVWDTVRLGVAAVARRHCA